MLTCWCGDWQAVNGSRRLEIRRQSLQYEATRRKGLAHEASFQGLQHKPLVVGAFNTKPPIATYIFDVHSSRDSDLLRESCMITTQFTFDA